MECKVIGYGKTEFKPQDSNEPIRGMNLYVSYEKDNVTGVAAERLFITEKKIGTYLPQVGDQVNIIYNRYGKVEAVELF